MLTEQTNPLLLISAGIGVTPVLAMLHQLVIAQSERDVWWIHATRDARQHVFAEEAHQLLQALPHAHEHIFFTAAPGTAGGPVISGRPTLAALAGLGLPVDASAYICGPTTFMNDMRAALSELGIPADRTHVELFGALDAINPGVIDARHVAPHQPPGPPGTGPLVTFARSGLAVRWSDRHRNLLELADACDLSTRWSCRTGVCHTCITPLMSGAIGYSPSPLEMPEGDQALICCARPQSDVVLDL